MQRWFDTSLVIPFVGVWLPCVGCFTSCPSPAYMCIRACTSVSSRRALPAAHRLLVSCLLCYACAVAATASRVLGCGYPGHASPLQTADRHLWCGLCDIDPWLQSPKGSTLALPALSLHLRRAQTAVPACACSGIVPIGSRLLRGITSDGVRRVSACSAEA